MKNTPEQPEADDDDAPPEENPCCQDDLPYRDHDSGWILGDRMPN